MSVTIGLDLVSDRLMVTMRNAQGKEHTIRLRFDADLFIHLHTILSNHQDGEAPLNTKGSPTQALVDEWLAKGNKVKDESLREEERAAQAQERLADKYGQDAMAILSSIKLDI